MVNPYSNQDFFGFFLTLCKRLVEFISGNLPLANLASDELQLIVLGALAASGALVGTFLILRRMAMLANALSHTILLGIVILFLIMMFFSPKEDPIELLSIPLLMIAAFITGIVTTFLTEFLTRVVKLQEDASIGLVFSILFALGVILVSLFTRNVHVGTELVMGNVDALHPKDLSFVLGILAFNIVLTFTFFKGYKVTSFDPQLARTFGFSPLIFNYLLMIQTSATAIGGFRAVGVLMILAFLVLPVLTARLMTHSLSKLIIYAMGGGILASTLGVALSRHLLTIYGIGFSTGGIVVVLLGVLYGVAIFFAPERGLFFNWVYRRKRKDVPLTIRRAQDIVDSF